MKSLSISIAVLTLASALLPAPGAAQDVNPVAARLMLHFTPATLQRGQSARVNLVNLTNPPDPDVPPDSCRVQVRFFNAAGGQVGGVHSFALLPGHSATTSPATDQGLGAVVAAPPSHLRATVNLSNPPDPDTPPDSCRIAATFEVFNAGSGQTMFAVSPATAVLINPPEPDLTGGQ